MKKMGVFALMACMLPSLAEAKTINGPKPGSVCDSAIAGYLGKAGSMMKHTVLRIAPYVGNGTSLKFGYYDSLPIAEGIDVENLLQPIELPAKVLNQLVTWGMNKGLWLVVTPATDDRLVAQVFVAGLNQRGKAACLDIYDEPATIDPALIPDAVME